MKKDLKSLYIQQIVPSLLKDYGYKNVELVPKLLKISVNRGLGEDARNSKEMDASLKEFARITGQKPTVNEARQSIAGFKIREGMPVGASVTLRKELMYALLERLIRITLPRVRDFRGISADAFDGRGNYNLGIKDQLIFPEISYDEVKQLQGLDICIVTSANTDEEAYSLLKYLGLPLQPKL